jgi:adenylate cyclase
MQQPPPQRRLAAILAADVVGFSRMMGADEEGTLARLKRIRETLTDPAIAEWRGRIFKTTGDGFLAEFPSVVDAVQCAAKIQVAMAARPAEPAGERTVFRMGINLGDVIVEGDDLYGDGVNVAARLEGACEPGGVAVSASAHDQVRGKVALGFLDRGEQAMKNIARPVRVYALDLRAHGVASGRPFPRRRRKLFVAAPLAALALLLGLAWFQQMRKPEAAAPVIAVLPFANQSGDAARDYFSEGVTEDITNALGRFSGLRVIAHNTAQGYKGRAGAAEEAARELGARYIVRGSVREEGGKVRVGVELSDAMRGTLLWSERYEGEGREVFGIQDRIVRNVVGTLAVKLTALEQQRSAAKPPDSLEAYDLVLRARERLARVDRVPNREARVLLAQAVKLSPGYAEAHVALAEAEFQRAVFGWMEDPRDGLQRVLESAQRAIALDEAGASARAHALLGSVHSFTGRFDEALAESERALALNPSDALAYGLRGDVLLWLGRTEEAIAASETAFRFDPRIRGEIGFNLSLAYYLAGRHRDAVKLADGSIARGADTVFLHAVRAAALAQLGEAAEAKRAAEDLRRGSPFFKAELFGQRLMKPEQRAAAQAGLKKAGF